MSLTSYGHPGFGEGSPGGRSPPAGSRHGADQRGEITALSTWVSLTRSATAMCSSTLWIPRVPHSQVDGLDSGGVEDVGVAPAAGGLRGRARGRRREWRFDEVGDQRGRGGDVDAVVGAGDRHVGGRPDGRGGVLQALRPCARSAPCRRSSLRLRASPLSSTRSGTMLIGGAAGEDPEVGRRLGVDAPEAHLRQGAGDGDEGVDPLLGGDAGVGGLAGDDGVDWSDGGAWLTMVPTGPLLSRTTAWRAHEAVHVQPLGADQPGLLLHREDQLQRSAGPGRAAGVDGAHGLPEWR